MDYHSEPPTVSSPETEPARQAPRVLVVDDTPLNAKLAIAQLESGGFDATAVGSGEAALEAIAAGSYSVVLMDCELPGMDGCETTREIRRRENDAGHTVVVGLSSNTAGAARERCLRAGMDGYIERPVSASSLIEQVRRLSESVMTSNGEPAESGACASAVAQILDVETVIGLAILPGPNGSPLLVELIRLFLGNLPALLSDLTASGVANAAQTARAAHRLKSACTSLGGARLAAVCREIEDACSEQPSIVERLIKRAHDEASALVKKLEEIPLR